jgi:hypothetical protein
MSRQASRRILRLTIVVVMSSIPPTRADDIPEYLKNLVAPLPTTAPAALALRDALALDDQMQGIYSSAQELYKKNLLANSPVILGLFSNQGGDFYLYRPGKSVIRAARVPVGYEICKSCGHSAMAVYQLAAPYLGNTRNLAWRTPMAQQLVAQEAALAGFDQIELAQDAKDSAKTLLRNNIAFMKGCLTQEALTAANLERFARSQRDPIAGVLSYAARAQASHWMKVMSEWKTLIGNDWKKTYGVTNTLYVTRTNNILFTIMAQFFGREAFNDRLFLFETTNFVTTPDQMIDELSRIVSDRALGRMFFNDDYLMDTELVSNEVELPKTKGHPSAAVASTFTVVAEECKALGIEPILPPLGSFHSHHWPWNTDARDGSGPKTLREALQQTNPNGKPTTPPASR